ncbi:MAG: hypothetical protein MUC38_01040 [Cyclobacteriaceae bacterium]|jgi:hypothetical protein|nr:hypothetical protein [Cyclobacteriaceae bacterium]
MKKNILTMLLSVGTLGVFAQEYVFKVLANKGANEVKTSEGWTPIKTGASLKQTDELKIVDNAYMGLVHSTGKPIEIKQAGNYSIAQLASKITAGTSVMNKYTDFILSSNSDEGKKNRMAATGSVSRAVGAGALKVFMPPAQAAGVFGNTAVVNWEARENASPYVVTVRDMEDNVLFTTETPQTQMVLDLSDATFASQTAVLVEVRTKADAKTLSERYVIKRLNNANKDKIKKLYATDLGAGVEEESALNKIVLASFYEQNGLLIDAIAAYEQAIKLAPEVQDYKDAYAGFLARNGIKAEEKK